MPSIREGPKKINKMINRIIKCQTLILPILNDCLEAVQGKLKPPKFELRGNYASKRSKIWLEASLDNRSKNPEQI